MKKSMKKFMVACAAASAIAVAAGMSAMAAEVTYNAENNSAPINVPTDAAADTQKTVLVIPEAAKNNVTDADILYINQDSTLPENALLKAGTLADGKYLVMVGYYNADGAFAISEDSFTIGTVTPAKEILVGDADQNKRITTNDAAKVLAHTGKSITLTDDAEIAAAKSDGNTRITTNDATEILMYTSKVPTNYVGTIVTVE